MYWFFMALGTIGAMWMLVMLLVTLHDLWRDHRPRYIKRAK